MTTVSNVATTGRGSCIIVINSIVTAVFAENVSASRIGRIAALSKCQIFLCPSASGALKDNLPLGPLILLIGPEI